MRYLIFSDVHGNLPALEKVLHMETGIDGYINLGDVVNYGPWSNECVELIHSLENCVNILGNHEKYFLNGVCDVKSELVQSFFNETYPSFTNKDKIFEFIEEINIEGFRCTHTIEKIGYVFMDSEVQLKSNRMIGHSHQQYIRNVDGYLLLNPGSIGQNRRIINVSNYAVFDSSSGDIQLKSLEYNLDLVISEMISRGYPSQCINYYKTKKRV